MKYLLILISFNCFAGGFLPVGKAGFNESSYSKLYEFKEECEKSEAFECQDVSTCPTAICSLSDNVISEVTKTNISICSSLMGTQNCDEQLATLVCTEGVPNGGINEGIVYCAVTSPKVAGKKLVIDSVKQASVAADRAAKQAAKADKIANRESNKKELFALKKADIDAMTVSQRNAVLFKLLNIVQDLQE